MRSVRMLRMLRIDTGQFRYQADAVSPKLRSNEIAPFANRVRS